MWPTGNYALWPTGDYALWPTGDFVLWPVWDTGGGSFDLYCSYYYYYKF